MRNREESLYSYGYYYGIGAGLSVGTIFAFVISLFLDFPSVLLATTGMGLGYILYALKIKPAPSIKK